MGNKHGQQKTSTEFILANAASDLTLILAKI